MTAPHPHPIEGYLRSQAEEEARALRETFPLPALEREPLVVDLHPVGGGYPVIELPHRGVTIRTLQGAAARAHSEWPGQQPPDTFKLRLKGVIIGTITIKPT